jgi:hypothetical protein
MSNSVPWLMQPNFRSEGVQKTVDRYKDAVKALMVGMHLLLHCFEARHAFSLEDLHGIGFELVIAIKAVVQTHHALGPVLCHGADESQGKLPLQADEECAAGHAVDGLACEGELRYRRGEGEATFEEDFVEDVFSRAAVADVVDV